MARHEVHLVATIVLPAAIGLRLAGLGLGLAVVWFGPRVVRSIWWRPEATPTAKRWLVICQGSLVLAGAVMALDGMISALALVLHR